MAGLDPAMAVLQLQLCPGRQMCGFLSEAVFLS
jgi:hypothetical protein